ncbi:MAG: hypothetical protein KJ623_02955, partial [Nanoarchaeota archaeon]|nr:hypothetical protein [Nanoarchaeota archaeon]
SFFYEKSKEYPELFKSFNFRNDSAYFPFSGELDHARTTMSFCGLLQSFGMDFNPHEFTPKCRIRFENEVKKIFSTEDLSKLEQISIEFQNKFGVEHL